MDDIRDDMVLIIAGEGMEAELWNYATVFMELNTKDGIYLAMVIYGLFIYMDGEVLIPNKELMDKFKEFLMNKESWDMCTGWQMSPKGCWRRPCVGIQRLW